MNEILTQEKSIYLQIAEMIETDILRDILLEEVLRQAGIPLLRSHDARKLLQMTGEWLNTTGTDQQSPEHRS
mgnify:FL=1